MGAWRLPALGFELKVVGNEGPVQRWHPLGDVVAFMDPCLVVVVEESWMVVVLLRWGCCFRIA